MPGEKTSHIVRLQGGSIDYHHYAARGMIARNKKLKTVVSKIFDATKLPTHTFPALLTVILLMLLF
jgi:hypothetical protein